jgi:hypothetical protein
MSLMFFAKRLNDVKVCFLGQKNIAHHSNVWASRYPEASLLCVPGNYPGEVYKITSLKLRTTKTTLFTQRPENSTQTLFMVNLVSAVIARASLL